MSFDLSKYVGEGLDQLDEINSLPLIKLLQDMHDEVKTRHKNYVPGAEPGLFLITKDNTVTEGPLEAIVLSTRTLYVEWKPRSAGGGLVGYHGKDIVTHPKYRKGNADNPYKEFLGDNDLEYTTYWAIRFRRPGQQEWEEGVISHTSTQLAVARDWNKALQGIKHPDLNPGVKAPIFSTVWELGSYLDQSRSEGEYFGWTVKFKRHLLVGEDAALLEECAKLSAAARQDLQAIPTSKGLPNGTPTNALPPQDEVPF